MLPTVPWRLHISAWAGNLGFDPNPVESLLPFGECAHLHNLAVPKGENICDMPFDPFQVVFQFHSHMQKHNDLIACDNEPFRLATSFSPSFATLRQVRLHLFMP